jgi:hypothetical protein
MDETANCYYYLNGMFKNLKTNDITDESNTTINTDDTVLLSSSNKNQQFIDTHSDCSYHTIELLMIDILG